MLSIRKLMRVVKDVDLEAMPSSIFVNDDDDNDDVPVDCGGDTSICKS